MYERKKVRCWHFWRKHWDCGPLGHICLPCWKAATPSWMGLGMLAAKPSAYKVPPS